MLSSLAPSGQNEMWAQLRSDPFRSLSGRAPVFPGVTMYTTPLRAVSAELQSKDRPEHFCERQVLSLFSPLNTTFYIVHYTCYNI